MGRFGGRVGVLEALTFATGVQLVLADRDPARRRGRAPAARRARSRRRRGCGLGGLMGLIVVFTITFAQPRIGATATIGILIAGQLVMGAVIDRFGLFGVDQIAHHLAAAARDRACSAPGAALSLVQVSHRGEGVDGPLGRLHHLGLDVPLHRDRRSRRSRRCSRSRRGSSRRARSWPRSCSRPRRHAARRRGARSRSCVADRLPAAGRERRALLRRAGRPDRARVADHRVGPAVGRAAPARAATSGCTARCSPASASASRRRDPAAAGGRRDHARDRPLPALGGDVVGRLGRRGAAADAGRPVRRDDLGDARRRPRDAAARPRRRRARSRRRRARSLAWLYLVTIGSVVGYTAYTWLLANAPLGLVSTYAYVEPGGRDPARRALPRTRACRRRSSSARRSWSPSVALVVRQEPPSATQPEEGVR